MRKDGKKTKKEREEAEALVRECQYFMIKRKLKPAVQSFYNRTAFQLPGDARVRISLDTELILILEDNWDEHKCSGDSWHQMDIGVDWPFNQLPTGDVERFPYAILEVKLQTQAGQEPPSWVKELVSSHLVEAVPKFSKFIHGTATLFPDKINLLPFWLPQMGVDIRKPVTHRFGIERPNQLSSASTSDEMLDSDDESEAEDVRAKSVVTRNGPQTITNGGGGNVMDQEERVAADVGEDEPLYDSEDDDDVDGNSRRRPPRRSLRGILTTAVQKVGSVFHRSTPVSDINSGINPLLNGAPTYKVFKAPPGKRIFVPVRVEPKVFFAAERTFLSWFEFSIYLGAISALLLNFGADSVHPHKARIALYSAWSFTVAAVLSLGYSLFIYLWRIGKIKKRRAVRYHDKWGPTALCCLLGVSVALNMFFNLVRMGL